MISLFIDTSYKSLFIGLIDNEKVIDQICIMAEANFSEKLIPLLKEIIEKNNIKLDSINKIFVTIGPGSFTGIRIGVTVCKILGFALNTKIVPLSSLEFMATTMVDTDYIIPFIDARHDMVFAGVYDFNGKNIIDDSYCNINELTKKVNGSITYISYDNIGTQNTIVPNYDVSKIIKNHLQDTGLSYHEINPNYLKKTEAEERLV